MKKLDSVVVLLSLVTLTSAGCYTLLQHPRLHMDGTTDGDNQQQAVTALSTRDDCVQCHSDAHVYYNNTLPFSNYYSGRSRTWLYYYDAPWWTVPSNYSSGATEVYSTPSPRDFGRRHYQEENAPPQPGASATTPPPQIPVSAKRSTDGQQSTTQPEASQQDNRRGERRTTSTGDSSQSPQRVKNSSDGQQNTTPPQASQQDNRRDERRTTTTNDNDQSTRREKKKKDN